MNLSSNAVIRAYHLPAGASGCTVASRLARSSKRPTVLLLEAGGTNDDQSLRVSGDRWTARFNPPQAWGYRTVPQRHLDGLVIQYDRGRGLGGTTAVNFCAYNVGPRDDFEEIARLVGDEEWKWENAHQRLKRLESYSGRPPDVSQLYEKYLNPNMQDHGDHGLLKIGFPAVWEKNMTELMDVFADAGYHLNPDLNDGDPIGISVSPSTAHKGVRTTAADMLVDAPSNLVVLTNAQVARVIFQDKIAIGISTMDGQTYYARSEVILSAGSLDTPKILMHSGVGPADQLEKHGIPVIHESPHVGQGLRDHHHIRPTWIRADHTTERKNFYRSKEVQTLARSQWETDCTGPLAEIGCVLSIGMLRSDTVHQSEEFKALPKDRQAHMLRSTVPSYEIILNSGNAEYFVDPDNTPAITSINLILMNTQSSGSVTLQSSDPAQPLLFDPNFFEHPYDRRLAVEATREVLKMARNPGFLKDTVGVLHAPNSDSEKDILNYWKETTGSTWHMTGTCKMGKEEGKDEAVVDPDFRVMGVKSLRVVDMSVVPIMPKSVCFVNVEGDCS